MSWFPRLNTRGDVAYGYGDLFLNDQNIGRGVQPQWLDADTLIYRSANSQGIYLARRRDNWAPTEVSSRAASTLAAGGGWFASGYENTIRRSWSTALIAGYSPTMNRSGQLAFLADPTSPRQRVFLEYDAVDAGASCYDPSLAIGGLVWSRETTPGQPRETWGYRLGRQGGGPAQRLQASYSPEFEPIAIDRDGMVWILAHDLTPRCILYPWGETRGYVVHEGETFTPHGMLAMGTDPVISVVWYANGRIERREVALWGKRQELSVRR